MSPPEAETTRRAYQLVHVTACGFLRGAGFLEGNLPGQNLLGMVITQRVGDDAVDREQLCRGRVRERAIG